jgi:hypothetical protein
VVDDAAIAIIPEIDLNKLEPWDLRGKNRASA